MNGLEKLIRGEALRPTRLHTDGHIVCGLDALPGLSRLGSRYGFSDADIHVQLLNHRLCPARHDPVARQLHTLEDHQTEGNTRYVRASADLQQRLQAAEPYRWRQIAI
jgi:hypothetical protein